MTPSSIVKKVWKYICYMYSSILYLACVSIVLYAIIIDKTTFYPQSPNYANVIILVVLLFLLGCLEGMQICLIRLMKEPPNSYKSNFRFTWMSVESCSKSSNLERFLQGRQIMTTVIAFFLAKLTTLGNTGSFPQWFESGLLSTGLFGALLVVNTSQLSPRVIAIQYPIHFLNNIVINAVFRLCLFLEFTGIAYSCWLISSVISSATGLKIVEKEDTHQLEEVLDSSMDLSQRNIAEQLIHEEYNYAKSFPASKDNHELLVNEKSESYLSDFSKSVIVGKRKYPSAEKILQRMKKRGLDIPAFLLNPDEEGYIPPHAFACQLLTENQMLSKSTLNSKEISNTKKFSEFEQEELKTEPIEEFTNKVVSSLLLKDKNQK